MYCTTQSRTFQISQGKLESNIENIGENAVNHDLRIINLL